MLIHFGWLGAAVSATGDRHRRSRSSERERPTAQQAGNAGKKNSKRREIGENQQEEDSK